MQSILAPRFILDICSAAAIIRAASMCAVQTLVLLLVIFRSGLDLCQRSWPRMIGTFGR